MYHKIKDLREDNNKTQQQIADYIHVSQPTYSRYENGELDIPSSALIKLSVLYNTSVDYLLGLTDNPVSYERRQNRV